MSTTITGNAANGATDPVVLTTVPVNGDLLASAQIRTALQKIIDTIQNIRANHVNNSVPSDASSSIIINSAHWTQVATTRLQKQSNALTVLQLRVTSGSVADTHIGQLPAGYRPASMIGVVAIVTNSPNDNTLVVQIGADGNMDFVGYSPATLAEYEINVVYFSA